MPTFIPQSQQRLMRWKNGGGMTCEILRFPPGSSLDSFDWRVSVATVQQGGMFSVFPGIARSLAILEGKGLMLDVAGTSQELTPRDPIFCFDGETPVDSELIGGGIVDFNVMTRRSAYRHTLERLAITQQTTLTPSGDIMLIYVINGSCSLPGGNKLHAGDAVWFEADEESCVLNACAAELMLVQLQAA
jgi:environmental stress-induced protein Ves